jgi:flagellar basal-body rod modification protein FlgD
MSVEVDSDRLSLQGGTATLRLPPAGAATQAQVTVADAAGRVLTRANVTLGAGGTDWQWNGRDTAGKPVPDGAYRFAVAGRDATGTPQAITATVVAKATAAERAAAADGGGLQLVLGGLSVGFDALRSLGR